MASIPLPALHINPPADPSEGMQRMMALKQMMDQSAQQRALMPGQLQQQKQTLEAGQQENAMRAQQMKNIQAQTAAMHEWDGKSLDELPGLMLKHGATADVVMSTRQGLVKYQQELAAKDKAQLENEAKSNDLLLGHVDAIKGATDPQQRQQVAQSQAAQILSAGLHKHLDPQSQQMIQAIAEGQMVPNDDQLTLFEKGLTGHTAQIEQVLKTAESGKNTAQAGEATANTQKINQELQYGPSGVAADSKYRFLQQRRAQKLPIQAEDQAFIQAYEKQKKLVPMATAQVRVEGLAESRMYPVYDATKKVTRPVSAAELNRASIEEPDRYSTPSFSPEAITQQQTGKTFAPGGKGGEEALAFQTALRHAELLRDAAKALNNGDSRALNFVKNKLATQFGDPDITDFNAIKHVYENEIQKMISAGHITDAELKKNDVSLPDVANFQTLDKVLNSYQSLAQSKLTLRKEQQQLGKEGKSMVDAPTQQSTSPGGAGVIYARDKDGKLHSAPAGSQLPDGWTLEKKK